MSKRNSNDRVIRLLGNHETYFVLSDRDQDSYVDPEDFRQFCDAHEVEEEFWLQNQKRSFSKSSDRGDRICRAERRAAFSINGPIGKDIRANFKLVHIFRSDRHEERRDADGLPPMDSPKTLFVHAGLEPYVLDYIERVDPAGPGRRAGPGAEADLEGRLNAAAREALRTLVGGGAATEAQEALFEAEGSAVWTRRFALRADDGDCASVLHPVLRRLNVARMVRHPLPPAPPPPFPGSPLASRGPVQHARTSERSFLNAAVLPRMSPFPPPLSDPSLNRDAACPGPGGRPGRDLFAGMLRAADEPGGRPMRWR